MDQTPTTNTTHGHSRSGMAWVSLVTFVVLLLLLAIFILQNSNGVKISYLGFHGNIPLAAAMLIAVIVGAALTVLVGSIRIYQLKHRVTTKP